MRFFTLAGVVHQPSFADFSAGLWPYELEPCFVDCIASAGSCLLDQRWEKPTVAIGVRDVDPALMSIQVFSPLPVVECQFLQINKLCAFKCCDEVLKRLVRLRRKKVILQICGQSVGPGESGMAEGVALSGTGPRRSMLPDPVRIQLSSPLTSSVNS